jgi:hypothetical protein
MVLAKAASKERKKYLRKLKISSATDRSKSQKGAWSTFDVFKGSADTLKEQLDETDFCLEFQKLSYDYCEKTFACPTSDLETNYQNFNSSNDNYFNLELPLKVGCNIEHLDILCVLNSSSGSRHAKELDGYSRELFRKVFWPSLL